jgi:CHAD domain-containing protein
VAFGLRADESIGKGLRRVVRSELRKAGERLTGDRSDEAIHEARKSLKKVRAVLRLVGDDLHASGSPKHLRRANRLISPLRDADALIETAQSLGRRGRALDALDARLTAQKARLTASAKRKHTREDTARALARVRRDTRDWRWKRTDFSVLADATTRSYKRARKSMLDAREHREGERFHEWRKTVKTLWYALRLLEGRGLPLGRHVADFKRLQTWLGDDHNLVVLGQQLQKTTSPTLSASDRAHLFTLIERRLHTLRRQALTLGARLFADSPKEFARRLRKMSDTTRASRRAAAAA